METHVKGKKCEEVTEDIFKKLGKGQPGAESKRTKEYYQGGTVQPLSDRADSPIVSIQLMNYVWIMEGIECYVTEP